MVIYQFIFINSDSFVSFVLSPGGLPASRCAWLRSVASGDMEGGLPGSFYHLPGSHYLLFLGFCGRREKATEFDHRRTVLTKDFGGVLRGDAAVDVDVIS